MAYEQLTGPLGDRRLDLAAALIAAVTANTQRSKGRPLTPADFLPRWGEKRRGLTPEELFHKAMAANTALGGKVAARRS